MSVHVSSWAWQHMVGDAGAKLVLVKLADNANDEGFCWPSQTYLAVECEMSRATVQRKLYLLRDRELIDIRQRRPNPQQPERIGSNLYQLRMPQREAMVDVPMPQIEAGVASQAGGGSLTGDAAEPSSEPSKNHVVELLDNYDFTPKQREQILAADEERAVAWLIAGKKPPPNVRATAGWLLTGIRNGGWPPGFATPKTADERFDNARKYVERVGSHYDDDTLRDELRRFFLEPDQVRLLLTIADTQRQLLAA